MDNSYIIDLTRLKSGIDEYIFIDEDLDIKNTSNKIIEIKKVHINGDISLYGDSYYLNANLSGTLVLPSSLTLKPVNYDFSTDIEGSIEEMLEEIGEIDKKRENSIDIFPIIWENILMEIPIKVESEDLNPPTLEGNGWRFIEDDKPEINPEFMKLDDLKWKEV